MKWSLVFFFSFISAQLSSQYDHFPVLSSLTGQELFDELNINYKPIEVLTYGMARDTMFGIIDNVNDTVYGIYSEFGKYLDPSADPTTFLYEDGGEFTINTEHSYPQSKGAGQYPAKSDLHHLFPTRTFVNSERGSDMFGEINDNQTEKWFYRDKSFSQIPNSNIDAYTEAKEGQFEPRESVKGNIARAMFYFYTIYREQAINADPDYFDSQVSTLCDWHFYDPVDKQEWDRSYAIANYQDDKANPFVLDCSLASRLYCEQDLNCGLVGTNNILDKKVELQVFPNPSNGYVNFILEIDKASEGVISVFDSRGKEIYNKKLKIETKIKEYVIEEKFSSGLYLIVLNLNSEPANIISRKVVIE